MLDLRDLAKEYEDLKALDGNDTFAELSSDEQQRLADLKALDGEFYNGMAEYAENEPTMIEDCDFEDYAQELADELGYMSGPGKDNPLMGYIDWERWANDLKQDYTEVTFDGDTYLIRAY